MNISAAEGLHLLLLLIFNFFFSGAKFTRTSDGTRIIESDGTTLTLESNGVLQHLAPETQKMMEYFCDVGISIITQFFSHHNFKNQLNNDCLSK